MTKMTEKVLRQPEIDTISSSLFLLCLPVCLGSQRSSLPAAGGGKGEMQKPILTVAKKLLIRAWVNRSERLRGEPLIE